MLGISVLDVLKNDLSRVLKRLAKDGTQAAATIEIEELRQKKGDLVESIAALDAQIERLEASIDSQRAVIDELHHQYEVKGGDVIEQRQDLMQQRADLLAEIDQNQIALVDVASGSLPLIIVQDLISEIKLQAEDEHNDQIMQQAIGMIENILERYVADHSESLITNTEFVEFIRKTTQEELLVKKSALRRKLDELESYLSLDINENKLEGLFATIREEEATLVQYEVGLASLQQERSSMNAALISVTSEYSRAVESYLKKAELFDDEERLAKYSNMALRITEEEFSARQLRNAIKNWPIRKTSFRQLR